MTARAQKKQNWFETHLQQLQMDYRWIQCCGILCGLFLLASSDGFTDQSLFVGEQWHNSHIYYGIRFQSRTSPTDKLIVKTLLYEYERALKHPEIGRDTPSARLFRPNTYQVLDEHRQELQKHYADIERLVQQGIDPSTSDLPSYIDAATNLAALTAYGIPIEILKNGYVLGKDAYDSLTRSTRYQRATNNLDAALLGPDNQWIDARFLGMEVARYAQSDPAFRQILDAAIGMKMGVSSGASEEELLNSDPGLRAWIEVLKLNESTAETGLRVADLETLFKKFNEKLENGQKVLIENAKNAHDQLIRAETFSELHAITYMTTQFLSSFDDEIAQNFSTISTHVISLMDNLDKLNTHHFNPGETLLSVSALAIGNVFALANIFMSLAADGGQPSPFQVLYDALDKRLDALQEHIDQHLTFIHRNVMDGIHQLAGLIHRGFQALQREIQQNRKLLNQIQRKLDTLENWHRYTVNNDDQNFRDLYEGELEKTWVDCLGRNGDNTLPCIDPRQLINAISIPYDFATQKASRLNVYMKHKPTDDFAQETFHNVLNYPYYDEFLRLLLATGNPDLAFEGLAGLANPLAWAKGALSFITLLEQRPDVTQQFSPEQRQSVSTRIETLIQVGKQIQHGTDSIFYRLAPDGTKMAVKKSLVLRLVKDYLQALHQVDQDLKLTRRGQFEDQDPYYIDVWRDIDYQNPDPEKSSIKFFNHDQPLSATTNEALSPFFALFIPRPVLLAQRLGVGEIHISFENPGWTQIEVPPSNHSEFTVKAVLAFDIQASFFFNKQADDSAEVPSPFFLGIFSVQDDGHNPETLTIPAGSPDCAQWIKGVAEDVALRQAVPLTPFDVQQILFPERCPYWETVHRKYPKEQLRLLLENPNDLLIAVARQILNQKYLVSGYLFGNSGAWDKSVSPLFAHTQYDHQGLVNRVVEPFRGDFSDHFHVYGRHGSIIFRGTRHLNCSTEAAYAETFEELRRLETASNQPPIDYPALAQKLLADNFKPWGDPLHIHCEYCVAHHLTFKKIVEAPNQTPPIENSLMLPMLQRTHARFQEHAALITENLASKFEFNAAIQRLNGQYARLEAFFFLGLPNSMQVNEILQSFFNPIGSNQLLHGANLIYPEHRQQFLAIGIQRIKLLLTFLFDSETAENLYKLFLDENPELADAVSSIGTVFLSRAEEKSEMTLHGFQTYSELIAYIKTHYTADAKGKIQPIILEGNSAYLHQRLQSTESHDLIWQPLVWLEHFRSVWNAE